MLWSRKLIRTVGVLAATSLAAGCIDLTGGDVGEIYHAAKNAWSGGEKVSLQEAASVPYASIGMQIDGSTEIMLILASDSSGQQLWTSAARVAITTDHGRIVRTAGFERNLGGYVPRAVSNDSANGTHRWQADFPDIGLFSISVTCQEKLIGDETIVILGKNIRTRRVEEACKTEDGSLDWSFKNTYWRDPSSGLAWRSLQHVHPRLGPIEIEILRPPA